MWITLTLSYLKFIELIRWGETCLSSNLGGFQPLFHQILFFVSLSLSPLLLRLLWYVLCLLVCLMVCIPQVPFHIIFYGSLTGYLNYPIFLVHWFCIIPAQNFCKTLLVTCFSISVMYSSAVKSLLFLLKFMSLYWYSHIVHTSFPWLMSFSSLSGFPLVLLACLKQLF